MAWGQVTNAVNAVSPVCRTTAEVKKKWFDLKVSSKKRIAAHKRDLGATGGGQSLISESPLADKIAENIGEASMSGVLPDGDTESAIPSTAGEAEPSEND